MAQKTVVVITDDLDGSEATDTLSFAIDGTSYEIDLNEGNAKDMRNAFAPFITAARKTGGGQAGRKARASAEPKQAFADVDNRAVRAWAAGNGITVNPRGRIKADVVAQYKAAGN